MADALSNGYILAMRTETPQPIRLADYRPPAFLIDEVKLDFNLEPGATRVKAELQVRRNGAHEIGRAHV